MAIDNTLSLLKNGNFKMAGVEALPDGAFTLAYNVLTGEDTFLERVGKYWLLKSDMVQEKGVKLVRPHDALRLTHIGDRFPPKRVFDRYTHNGTYAPYADDLIVDVGAFIGEFSMMCQLWGCNVQAIEPDIRSYHCLKHNVGIDSIKNIALGDQEGSVMMNIASDPTESSILIPDKGAYHRRMVEQARLDTLFDEIDFLKVEGEGMEPEILLGLGPLEPHTIVVNVSAERDGKSPKEWCERILEARGYELDFSGTILVGTK